MGLLATITLRGGSAAARHILQLEDQRSRQLRELALAVDAVLEGPYKSALEDLELAAGAATDPHRAGRYLARAEDRFGLAFGNLKDVDPLLGSWAAVHLAVICAATDRRDDALHWSRRAHELALRAKELLLLQSSDRAAGRVGRLKLTSEDTELGVWFAGVGATGVGAAAAGVTIASGGLAFVAVGAALGATWGVTKGIELFRNHHLNAQALKMRELSDFIDGINGMRRAFGDSAAPPAAMIAGPTA
jgi:hypothetical protein